MGELLVIPSNPFYYQKFPLQISLFKNISSKNVDRLSGLSHPHFDERTDSNFSSNCHDNENIKDCHNFLILLAKRFIISFYSFHKSFCSS